LPKKKTGSSWFWPFLKDGETGVDLANRTPPIPPEYTDDSVMIWTRVSGKDEERNSVVLIGTWDGKMWSARVNKDDYVMINNPSPNPVIKD